MFTQHKKDDEAAQTAFRLSSFEQNLLSQLLPSGLTDLDPLRIQAISRLVKGLSLIQQERVITLMPLQMVIR